MKFLYCYLLLCVCPMVICAQGKVGIGTLTPDHPFQVNVDSIWTDTLEDYYDAPNIGFSAGLAITPGSQKGAQRFPVGQTGYLSSIKFYFAFPTNATQVLIEVYRGEGPGGQLMTSGLLSNVTIGAFTLTLAQPWSWVTAGETLHVVMSPLSGTSCKWKMGSFAPPDIPPFLAFHYSGAWDTIAHSLALATYITYADTLVHQILKVTDTRRVMFNDYSFPREDGNIGEILTTNGAGNIAWTTPSMLNVNALRDADQDTKVEVEVNPDEDIVRIKTAGTERMTLLANGNVGIGTTSPGNLLRIHGSTTSSQHVLSVGVNFSGANQIRAIEGFSNPGVGYGIGGYYSGGSRGIQSFAEGGASTGLSIAVEGSAYGTAGTRTGIFGRAVGGSTNWAGYFAEGNVRILNDMYIDGNVGIGTTSPGNKLRVNGSSTSSQHVLSAGTNYSGNIHIRAVEGFSTPAEGFGIGGYFVGGNKGVQAFGSGGASTSTVMAVEGVATGSAGTRVGLYGSASGGTVNWAGHFASGNVWMQNNLYVDGSVGIGTQSPSAKFNVIGSTSITQPVISGLVMYSGNSDVRAIEGISMPGFGWGIGGHFTGGSKGVYGRGEGGGSGTTTTGLDGSAFGGGGIKIGVRGDATGSGTNWAGYFNNGHVYITNELRIGSDAMSGASGYRVAIDGKLIAEEVRVQLSSAWPDYVFDEAYPLRSLSEVKSSIQQNGHLPGIPSASQVENDGLHLGDMQVRMLEKIEEMMIYILQQEEKIQELETQVKRLQNKNSK